MPIIPAEECGYCLPDYCLTKLELIPRIEKRRFGWTVSHELYFEVCIEDVKCTIPRKSWTEPPSRLWIPDFGRKHLGAGIHPLDTPLGWQGTLTVELRHPRPPGVHPGFPRGAVVCWVPTAGGSSGQGFPGTAPEPYQSGVREPDNIAGDVFDYGDNPDTEGVDRELICCKPFTASQEEKYNAVNCCEVAKNKLCECLNNAVSITGLPVGTSAGNCCFSGRALYPVSLLTPYFDSEAAAISATQNPDMINRANSSKRRIMEILRIGINDRLSTVLAICGMSGPLRSDKPEDAARIEFAINCRCFARDPGVSPAKCPEL